MPQRQRKVVRSGAASTVLFEALSEIHVLRGELEHKRAGMRRSPLAYTREWQMLQELSAKLHAPEFIPLPAAIAWETVRYEKVVLTQNDRKPSRTLRLATACAMLAAVRAALPEAREPAAKIDEILRRLDGLVIPGMFGVNAIYLRTGKDTA